MKMSKPTVRQPASTSTSTTDKRSLRTAVKNPEGVYGVLQRLVSVESIYSGPFPSAESFRQYEETTPGAGDRILSMAEDEQRHRHEMEKIALEASIEDAKQAREERRRAQWLAWSLSLTVLVFGCGLIFLGHQTAGLSITGGTIVGIIVAFLRNARRSEAPSDVKMPGKTTAR